MTDFNTLLSVEGEMINNKSYMKNLMSLHKEDSKIVDFCKYAIEQIEEKEQARQRKYHAERQTQYKLLEKQYENNLRNTCSNN